MLCLVLVITVTGWSRLQTTRSNIDANEVASARAANALRWESLTLLNVNRTLATGPLRQVAQVARDIADGDLTHRTEALGRDEVADVLRSLGHMQGSLCTIVGNVRLATDSITVASSEVAAGGFKRIADIIGVIDGTAFQANILALKAAVGAARAGEQGRGFAVVAGEVRALAHRVAEAAKEVKSLITLSVEQSAAAAESLKDQAGRLATVVSVFKLPA